MILHLKNLKRKWSYIINSPIFKMNYDNITGMIWELLRKVWKNSTLILVGLNVNITYSDKTKLLYEELFEEFRNDESMVHFTQFAILFEIFNSAREDYESGKGAFVAIGT